MLLAALPLSVALAACGATASGEAESPVPATPTTVCAGPDKQVRVPSYGPSGYTGDLPGDMPPNYAANHAFQRRLRLCGDELVAATAEAVRAKKAFDALAGAGAASVERTLVDLGYRRDHLTVTPGAATTFVVEVAGSGGDLSFCLDGIVGPDGVTVRADGLYSEGGCLKPEGGH